jgi:glycoprotein 6-alpha-L-fucosyltransferase
MVSMFESALSNARHHYNVVVRDLDVLAENDGHADWRKNEAAALSSIVQNRLTALQNPPDCGKARKLVCNLNKGCGYGCQVRFQF